MKYIFIIFIILLSACATTETLEVQDTNKSESAKTESYVKTTSGGFNDVVRDPIDYSSCSQNQAIGYDGKFFCSKETLEQYKNK